MKKIFLAAVITVMCMCCFVFGGTGFAKSVRDLDGETRPFEVFTCLDEMDAYRKNHEGDFFNLTQAQYASYTDAFFQQNALVMFLTQGMSGSIRCIAEDARLENSRLYVRVKELSPPMHTMDLHYNTLAVAVPQNVAHSVKSVCVEAYRVEI